MIAWETIGASLLAMGQNEYLIAGGTVLCLLVVVVVSLRGRSASPDSRQYRREIESVIREHDSVRQEIERLIKELEALAQRVGSDMDGRTRRLEQAIREADARIAALQRVQITGVSQPSSEAPRPDQAVESKPSPVPDEPASRYASLYALADEGHPAMEIARRTGQTVGEVELILNLRRPRSPNLTATA